MNGSSRPNTLDLDLTPHDIQSLDSADAVTAFFARLGWNTEARTVQTPGNLGITAEGTLKPIQRIELLADQEGLFQVYLFELKSVTVAHTRALARVFRNRAGNYLLILTSDYGRLDFVLLERFLPAAEAAGPGLAPRQVGIRPRILTVERRKPERVELRVLRRFTWTESDGFAQYDKLLSAYTIADWSEEHFNNRALFSDYYLKERLREYGEWREDPKPAFLRLRQIYQGAPARFAGKEEGFLRTSLFEPAFQTLGFAFERGKDAASATDEPDYRFYPPSAKQSPLALCLAYPWGRSLDAKDDQRDRETPEENPGAVVVSLLEKAEAPWVVVTNGRLWRLYSSKTHSRATNYYEIDLEEVLVQSGPHAADPSEAFRFFWLLFRREAFEAKEAQREGKTVSLSLLDRLLLESGDYAKRLGEALKERVFEEVFPHLAEGFIAHIRERDGLGADLSPQTLNDVFQGTLTFLYRLLFLLYAEARDLLPAKEVRGYFESSLTKLKGEISGIAKDIKDEAEANLKKHYRKDSHELYGRLEDLFRIVDKGDSARNVPVYNGGLFLSRPEKEDETAEAKAARFLLDTKVPDLYLARALDLLARSEDDKGHHLVPIDYKSLGVRQLGSIYEGLLEFKLRIAPEKMAVVKGKRTEEVVPYREAKAEGQRILTKGRGRDAEERAYKKGAVYIENDKRERKATGSYYTPDHIVKYIVEHAVGPVLQEKLEALRPRFREAQKWNRDMLSLAKAKGEPPAKYESGPAVMDKWDGLVREFFGIRVLDPAMGSGHFLVEAVDFVTDKMLDFLNAFPWNPVRSELEATRATILREMDAQDVTIDPAKLTDVNLLKRHVLKRCIYGVDLNPMAVELAKVSLWLDCFTLGAPLSFLDHHLKCGNSLIGVNVEEVRKAVDPEQGDLFGSRWAGLQLATGLMAHIGELSDVTAEQVAESRSEFGKALSALAPYKRILDMYASQWFGNGPESKNGKGKKKGSTPKALVFLNDPNTRPFFEARDIPTLQRAVKGLSAWNREVAEQVFQAAGEKRFFHWELEFPEVFFGPRPGTIQVIERLEGAGFDAVIGNPPYERIQVIRRADPATADFLGQRYESAVKNFDICLQFYEVGYQLTKKQVSYICSNKWLATDYGEGLRKFVQTRRALARVVDFRDFQVFDDATTYTCILSLSRDPSGTLMYSDASLGEIGEHVRLNLEDVASDGKAWSFASGPEACLLKRLLGGYSPLRKFRDRAFQGLRTSDNEVYVLKQEGKGKGFLRLHSRATGDFHEIERELLKPLLSGEDIRAFSLTESGQWILFPYDLSGKRPVLMTKKKLQSEFPSGWRYLKLCEARLRARENNRMDDEGWWAYIYPKNLDQFEQPKIMLPDYHNAPAAAVDMRGEYYSITAYCLTLLPNSGITLRQLACMLNSKVLFWALARIGTALQRGFVRFMPQYIERLPIAIPSGKAGNELENIAIRGESDGYESMAENLNAFIYALYNLSEDEIRLIESAR